MDEYKTLERVLEIYDQKFVADFLNKISNGRWCRETINRWSKGKANPLKIRLSPKSLPSTDTSARIRKYFPR